MILNKNIFWKYKIEIKLSINFFHKLNYYNIIIKITLNKIINLIYTKTTGKIIFQHKYINSSYRIRGNNPRMKITILTNKLTQKNITNTELISKNINLIINLKKIIIPYSPIKINANPPLKYSILNPDTNSDSPSIKSIGVRFNSAKTLIKNTINIGNINTTFLI